MDLLKACQRDGLVRLERDRRGGLRVFQGSALQRQPSTPAATDTFESQPIEIAATAALGAQETADADMLDSEPMPTVDPTAELLGRAKARRPRSRLAATPVAAPEPATSSRGRKSSRPSTPRAKSTTTTRSRTGARGKKSSAADTNDDIGNR